METSRSGETQQIHILTSLRFFAASWVVLHHFGQVFLPAGFDFVRKLFEAGATGVTFFFVLSGFILAVNYPLERLKAGPYLVARFARVYPLYAFSCIISLPFLFMGGLQQGWSHAINETVLQATLNGLLLQAWVPDRATLLNPASWSLSAEAFFYVMFLPALTMPGFRRFLDRTAVAVPVLWALGMVAPMTWILTHPGVMPSPGLPGPDAWTANLVSFHPLLRLPEFLLGVAFGRAYLRGASIKNPGWFLVIGGLVVLGLVGLMPAKSPLLHNGLPALPFALAIYGAAQSRGSAMARWVSGPIPVFLGEASYALYILHVPLYFWMRWASGRLGMDVEGPLWHLGYFLFALVSSSMAFLWIETPARKMLRRLSAR